MKYTIGLDFGTHQTKCCVEERDKNYQKIVFVLFKNNEGVEEYRLPSLIKVNKTNRLEYGFISGASEGKIYRYFKQATFNPAGSPWEESIKAEFFSVWYLTYLIFLLKEKYGEYFNINIGIPTDSTTFQMKKLKAVSLLCSAYRLAEDVFSGRMDSFLNATLQELLICTTITSGTDSLRKQYGINAYPEAWACIKPMLHSKRLSGLNMIIDIGGGTTDISLFSVIGKSVKLYYYMSLNKGLNYLAKETIKLEEGIPSFSSKMIDKNKLSIYESDIVRALDAFYNKLKAEFLKHQLPLRDLESIISKKPVIYTGGGSAFGVLRKEFQYFTDIRIVSTYEWQLQLIEKFPNIDRLCPILSTSYGLVVSSDDNSIKEQDNLSNLFNNLKGVAEDRKKKKEIDDKEKNDYHNNWREKEYGVLSIGGCSSRKRKRR